MKRSPINRGSGSGLSRSSPMKRSTKPMAKRSAKQKAKYAGPDGRRAFVARILAERPCCEAAIPSVCTHTSTDVHEVLRRSAGGSITDESGVKSLCRQCHSWVHQHPKQAIEIGLLRSRYDNQNTAQ